MEIKITEREDGGRIITVDVEDGLIEELKALGIDFIEEVKAGIRSAQVKEQE